MSDSRTHAVRSASDPWRDNELARRMRLREDARRPLDVNLAEGIGLSEFVLRIAGAARRKQHK